MSVEQIQSLAPMTPPLYLTHIIVRLRLLSFAASHIFIFFFRQFLDYVVKTTLREKKKKATNQVGMFTRAQSLAQATKLVGFAMKPTPDFVVSVGDLSK